MIHQRTVQLKLHENFGDVTGYPHSEEVSKAIGYLAGWAMCGESERYKGDVSIWGAENGNLSASYHDRLGMHTYAICGVFGGDGRYTFHS